MFDERNYLIIDAAEVSKINFDDVLETSTETLRYSVDGTKTFIKWDGEAPSWVSSIQPSEGPYTHEEILEILSASEWTEPVDASD